MLNLFRVIGFLEGVSYLLLLFIAMPIKYLNDNPEYVKMLGLPHGILFVAYVALAYVIGKQLKWNIKTLIVVILAAFIPFGTFYIDYKYLKRKG